MTDKQKLEAVKNIITVQTGRVAAYVASRKPLLDSGMLNLFKKIADDAETIAEVIGFE